MRKIILLTSACFLAPGTALSEMPYPKKPYSAELKITSQGRSSPANMFISGAKIRMDIVADEGPVAGQDIVFVADRKTGKAFTLTNMNGQEMAIKMDFNTAMEQINFFNQDLGAALGTKRIGFKECTQYKTMAGVTCLTQDHVVLEAYDDQRHLIVTKLKMGNQDPKIFEIPAGYQVIDFGGMLGGLSGDNDGLPGDFNIGDLSKMGSPAEIGKALSEGQNGNNEGFNNIMSSLGLPTENIDTPGEEAFANTLDGMIRNEVNGSNAEQIINGELSETEEFRQGLKMRNEMIRAMEDGEDPLAALMKRNGVSESEIADFRKQGKEIEALNASGGLIDQQIERADANEFDDLEAELKKLETINAEIERQIQTGQLTNEERARLLKQTKDIEQRVFAAMSGK